MDSVGISPLQLAAAKMYPSVVQILLEHNADLQTNCGKDRDTPLHLAIQNNDSKSIQLLLNKGAMIGATVRHSDQTGDSVRSKEEAEQDKIIQMIMAAMGSQQKQSNLSGEMYMQKLASSSPTSVAFRTDASGRVLDTITERGSFTGLLHLAAAECQAETVASLLKGGSDPSHSLRAEGFTPLAFAIINNHVEVIRLLIATRQVDVDAKFGSQNLLHIVAFQGYLEAAKLLIDAGADCQCKNHWNDLPLHRAAIAGRDEMVKLLLSVENGPAIINFQNKIGHTAMWLAARFGHIEVVAVLLNAGADPMIKTNNGSYARLGAEVGRHLEIVALLS